MTTADGDMAGVNGLGLIADPFQLDEDDSGDSAGVQLAMVSAGYRLLKAVRSAQADGDLRPIVVRRSPDVAMEFGVTALATVMSELVEGSVVEHSLPIYVPLDMMRIGRVRALLNVAAERIAGRVPDLVIAEWSRRVLMDPDTSIPEWDALVAAGFDAATVIEEIDEDPAAFSARVFGERVASRDGSGDYEMLMRVSTSRQDKLDPDPDTDAADLAPSEEDNADDVLAEVFTTPLGEIDDQALPEGPGDGLPALLLGDFIIAHTKKHLSPVIARGIGAYRAQGLASMSEELKISKAPTKSLLALFEFAKGVFDLGVVIYDRLEMWENVPADLRSKIVATLTELRWNLKDDAVLVLIMTPGTAPELEEGFAASRVVEWEFDELVRVAEYDAPYDADVVRHWLESASIDKTPDWADEALSAIPEGTSLAAACRSLSVAIQAAVASGRSCVSASDVEAALVAEQEAPAV